MYYKFLDNNCLNHSPQDLVGIDFDYFCNTLICQKYTVPVKNSGAQNKEKKKMTMAAKNRIIPPKICHTIEKIRTAG